MIRSWTLAAIAGGLAACSSIDPLAADPLPTETFKILPWHYGDLWTSQTEKARVDLAGLYRSPCRSSA